MDPDKQSLHLPAFGKDRKTSFLSFLPWASLCFAYSSARLRCSNTSSCVFTTLRPHLEL